MQAHYQKAVTSIVPQTLYVVATPIGNLADLSFRALAILSRADLICAEDTRVTQQLLRAYGVSARLISVREQNEQSMAERIIAALAAGQVVAQVSDAGTPAVCDPGARLVTRVREAGYQVLPVAGSSAVMTALSVAGVTQSDFYFAGFLPAKSGERQQRLQDWREVSYPVVMFETPHRIIDTLAQMALLYPQRNLMLAREISKTHETYLCGTVAEIQKILHEDANQKRGEMVLVLHPAQVEKNVDLSAEAIRVMQILAQELPTKQAAMLAAQISGENKKALYDWAIAAKKLSQ
ncbi:16S rRNA (cytidine(1402)-2'-O)-methyltransferase [Snodgrassella alvi]|jgi:16S rRNA (cytidine1402-2'-O)-methyltransferase|uniref:16S rRNA (cytidine(1402)-2'-O)-methyltransferase n=1 Tax=Snodgrassella alvi TaxID=1196083 RepID=UPI000C1F2DA1|nr:16S rRNA (cytidine(1402)-2'-O)-methyltransferase [Snodgrassella alvi]PIT10564.1 16S rRNA (cytidine(1402)-2'-O)-methyltransferase [Snodgrassella alvi]PIT25274.1 16S rRNA (cytidine(1402)-2'-O)-methyltransferase [Snodgrassella alvi]PIT25716.1 16S rRNA (cytidine(1402)-2'-O)-methyltransferase [Snodgrassella alvi]PIT27318.1 16S rRNA (cytidine(1402)-2'-O)-methyltransferase [Snodgrassella alvi]PIT47441.1 16S rRNA (cytidine(1402)-2'-O)-methyltransferase [Snodgrassella alvi]